MNSEMAFVGVFSNRNGCRCNLHAQQAHKVHWFIMSFSSNYEMFSLCFADRYLVYFIYGQTRNLPNFQRSAKIQGHPMKKFCKMSVPQ